MDLLTHIGCVILAPRLSFWAILGYGIRERAAELGVTLTTVTTSVVEEQAAAIGQFIRQRVDALIIGASGEAGLESALAAAKDARIPVIGVNSKPGDDSLVASTISADEARGISLVGNYLGERIGGQGKVALLEGVVTRRAHNVGTALAAYSGITPIMIGRGDWSRESGAQLMRDALKAHPDLRGVFAANDPMALGAVDVISDAGKNGSIEIAGYDGLPEALKAIHQGSLAATVQQEPRSIGRKSVDVALQAVNRANLPKNVYTETVLLTSQNLIGAALDAMDLLPGVLRDMVESGAAQRRLQDEIIATQRSLIAELSTPILPVSDQVLVAPLIGAIDSTRAAQITETVLHAITERAAHTLIIDISGISIVDTSVANHLIQTTRAAQLLGAKVILVGITPEVAQTIVGLGVELSGLVTLSTLQTAIEYATHRH